MGINKVMRKYVVVGEVTDIVSVELEAVSEADAKFAYEKRTRRKDEDYPKVVVLTVEEVVEDAAQPQAPPPTSVPAPPPFVLPSLEKKAKRAAARKRGK